MTLFVKPEMTAERGEFYQRASKRVCRRYGKCWGNWCPRSHIPNACRSSGITTKSGHSLWNPEN